MGKKEFKLNGKLKVIHRHGQPYGIRDNSGYLLFFPNVTKYDKQEQRYIDEIQEQFSLSEKIIESLKVPKEKENNTYTEAVGDDYVTILKNGAEITISEILRNLNKLKTD